MYSTHGAVPGWSPQGNAQSDGSHDESHVYTAPRVVSQVGLHKELPSQSDEFDADCEVLFGVNTWLQTVPTAATAADTEDQVSLQGRPS